MSLGYMGFCEKTLEDNEIVIYTYSGENWNDGGKSKSGDNLLQDGIIIINKICLEEPEIHIKQKKMPSGRKKTVEKIITHIPNITKYVLDKNIIVEKECKNAFKRVGYENMPIDYIAYHLLLEIFERYQKDRILPKRVGFIQ